MDNLKVAEKYYELMLKFARELSVIPAPSGFEDERAKYVYDYIKSIGYDNVYIDDAKNVVWKVEGESDEKLSLFLGHTDTVFPDTENLPYYEDDEVIRALGITDDTAAVCINMAISTYFKDINYKPKNTIMISANSCEEGLGNLKGVKKLFSDYGYSIKRMYSLDGYYSRVADVCVGSKRFLVKAKTVGGHSFGKFGAPNAIAILSKLVNKIYEIQVPEFEGSKTTYNVGTISGGTSVNTIAQDAEMLCEYRSNNGECMEIMEEKFKEIFAYGKEICPELTVELVGDRPGMKGVDQKELDSITELCIKTTEKYTGKECKTSSSSTDCNIPLSMGITAICIGNCDGKGAHTREEFLIKQSLKPGFAIACELMEYEGNR